MKKYQECIGACDAAIEQSKGGSYDYVKLAKAMRRKGNALVKMGQLDDGIEMFEKALLENQDHGIKMDLIAA
jgi:stress-induced-phosphoprotein 1